jgi:hypothetical protein
MKKLTASRLKKILVAALNGNGFNPDENKGIIDSIKIGKEADYHMGSNGSAGYFAIEDSILSSAYYDFPSIYHKFVEAVDAGLKPFGLFAEPRNSVEFGIYN